MFENMRINRIMRYWAEGMIAWIPSVLIAWIFESNPILKGTESALVGSVIVVLFAIAFVVWFVERGYRIVTLFGGYILVGCIVELTALL